MTAKKEYCVLLDANVWIAERLLQSSIGSAVLYALAERESFIGLPEVVELEVNDVLRGLAEKAVTSIANASSLLGQLSGQRLLYTAPTAVAISEGIAERWRQLDGVLQRIPFTHDHARSALNRVISKTSPCGENNEQFRDCCIWEAALQLARERTVYLVSNDYAFYDGRTRTNGLAPALRAEVERLEAQIVLCPSLRDFLARAEQAVAALDEAAIEAAILAAVSTRARELLKDQSSEHFDLGELIRTRIDGYATPRPSLVAVSFTVTFCLIHIEAQGSREEREEVTMTVSGVCSYDPRTREVSDVEVREWDQSVRGTGSRGTTWYDQSTLERRFSPSRTRVISS